MKNDRKQLFVNFLGLSGLTILLATFLLTLFGVVDLQIIEKIQFSLLSSTLINFTLLGINLYFLIKICSKYKNIKHLFLYILTGLIISLIFNYLRISYTITSFIVPIFVFLLSTIINKNFKFKYKGFLLFTLITCIFQIVTKFIKLNYIGIEHLQVSSYSLIIYSIDLIIYLYYYKKVVKNYGKLVGLLHRKHFLYTKSDSFSSHDKTIKDVAKENNLQGYKLAKFYVMVMGYQIIQLLVVLAIGTINNMVLELLIMLPTFWVGRAILQKSWHSDKLWICSVCTFSGFYILTKVTPPFEISLFLVIILTGVFVWFLYYIGLKADRLEELEKKYETDFTKYGLSYEMAQFAYDWKVNGLHDKELMVKYEINSINTLNSRKRRIKSAMNTK